MLVHRPPDGAHRRPRIAVAGAGSSAPRRLPALAGSAAGIALAWAALLLSLEQRTLLAVEPDPPAAETPAAAVATRLYVVVPGIRNYLEYGGAGVLVFDVDGGYRFIERIATPASQAEKPENIKGVCASVEPARLYFTTLTRLYALDLASGRTLWERELEGGCDRPAITPDGRRLFVPSYEGPHWNVVDASSGEPLTQITPRSRAHNTICSLDGKRVFLAGLGSNILSVADTASGEIVLGVGPFSAPVRPFTVDGEAQRCYVNVNELLGFEIGDLATGRKLARVEIEGFPRGKPARHGCPSHGIALSPDQRELWVCDAFNRRLHVFDAGTMPPRRVADVALREEPGWVSFSLDGRRVYASTGEVIDAASRRIIAALADETGREVHSEKLLEIEWADARPVRVGDQFGIGQVR